MFSTLPILHQGPPTIQIYFRHPCVWSFFPFICIYSPAVIMPHPPESHVCAPIYTYAHCRRTVSSLPVHHARDSVHSFQTLCALQAYLHLMGGVVAERDQLKNKLVASGHTFSQVVGLCLLCLCIFILVVMRAGRLWYTFSQMVRAPQSSDSSVQHPRAMNCEHGAVGAPVAPSCTLTHLANPSALYFFIGHTLRSQIVNCAAGHMSSHHKALSPAHLHPPRPSFYVKRHVHAPCIEPSPPHTRPPCPPPSPPAPPHIPSHSSPPSPTLLPAAHE